MSNKIIAINRRKLQDHIVTIRGLQVMIDRDLAELYGTETKVFNQAVRRNIERFPESFRFQLTQDEKNELVTNCDRFDILKHATALPHAFTEQGVAMLSAVLRSETAVKVSIQIMQAFVEMRRFIATNAGVFQRLDKLELKQVAIDDKFEQIFTALEDKSITPRQGIFYDGQIFDAYVFVARLIKTAKTSIVLIDNYVDESVFYLFSKRAKKVTATIYTKKITKALKLDLQKYNSQFQNITIKEFKNSHDRFLIIDQKHLYHFGASLKDMGKKWFAFSRMDTGALDVLNKIAGEVGDE